jgi:hypothetical protein
MIIEWLDDESTEDVVLRPKFTRLSVEELYELSIGAQLLSEGISERFALALKTATASVLDKPIDEVTTAMVVALSPSLMDRVSALRNNVNGNATPKN